MNYDNISPACLGQGDGLPDLVGRIATLLRAEGGWYAVLRVPSSGSDEALAVHRERNPLAAICSRVRRSPVGRTSVLWVFWRPRADVLVATIGTPLILLQRV